MKNKMFGLLLVVGVLFLTGCGGNSNALVCEIDMTEQLSGLGTMKASVEIEYDKEDKIPESLEMVMDINITSDAISSDQMSQFKSVLESQCSTFGKTEVCEVTVKGKSATMVAKGKITEMYGDAEFGEDSTKEHVKEYFEKSGFECK